MILIFDEISFFDFVSVVFVMTKMYLQLDYACIVLVLYFLSL
jgi:hypothetical protein